MSWLTIEIIREQRRDLPICIGPEQCRGATLIVTGSNKGLVILAVRNLEAGEAAKVDIETTTKTEGVVEVWRLDLGNYASVKAYAAKARNLDRLDGLIGNASIALDKWSTSEGHETSMVVNVYSTFLLAVLLLPKLKETATKFGISPHLVVLSSGYAFSFEGEMEGLRKGGLKGLDDMDSAKMTARYAVTKMVQIWLCRGLAQRYPPSATGGLTHHMNFILHTSISTARALMARTPEMGSRTILHAMSVGDECHGQYLDNCKLSKLPSWMTSEAGEELQKRL